MEMSKEAIEARRAYNKRWRELNAEHVREYHKAWRSENPEKVKQYKVNYWERLADEQRES